jgi:hypothetical protein
MRISMRGMLLRCRHDSLDRFSGFSRQALLRISMVFLSASFFMGLVMFEMHDVGLWRSLFGLLPGASAIRAISRFGFIQLYLSSFFIACAFEFYCQSSLRFRWTQPLGVWLAIVVLSFVNVLGAHPFANVSGFFPMVRSLHSGAIRQGCEVLYLHPQHFNPLIANALALQPAPGIKVINGYSGWPSP